MLFFPGEEGTERVDLFRKKVELRPAIPVARVIALEESAEDIRVIIDVHPLFEHSIGDPDIGEDQFIGDTVSRIVIPDLCAQRALFQGAIAFVERHDPARAGLGEQKAPGIVSGILDVAQGAEILVRDGLARRAG